MVFPAPARLVGVGHIAGGLFQVRHEAAPFDHFRENIRDTFAGQVHAAKLRHRIVSIFVEDAGVQLFSPLHADPAFAAVPGSLNFARKFVEKETAKRFCGARVAREQGALDGFRQIRQREHRAGEV